MLCAGDGRQTNVRKLAYSLWYLASLIFDLVRLLFGQANGMMATVHGRTFAPPIPNHEAPRASSNREAGKRGVDVHNYFTTRSHMPFSNRMMASASS